MPRKPFKPYADRHPGGQIRIGTQAVLQRPVLLELIGKCLIAWPNIEAEMALALGQLLGAENSAAMALFHTLRRSSAQCDAISEAGKASLNETDIELLTAILNVHKSIESERNALAHGHMGIYTDMDDAVLWLSSSDYISFKSILVPVGDRRNTQDKRDLLNSCLYYYKAPDLEAISNDIDLIGWIWSELIAYLRQKGLQRRVGLYRQLCDRPRIAQELARLRRERTSPSPP